MYGYDISRHLLITRQTPQNANCALHSVKSSLLDKKCKIVEYSRPIGQIPVKILN